MLAEVFCVSFVVVFAMASKGMDSGAGKAKLKPSAVWDNLLGCYISVSYGNVVGQLYLHKLDES